MTAGNVLNFGADPLGNDDSYPAFQAAIDSPHPVNVPPGYYYLSQTVIVSKPKIIRMTKPLLEPFDNDPLRRPHRGPGPSVPESHTRLWTDQNINFFEICSPRVFFEGGAFDAQRVTGWDKAAFYYPGEPKDHNNRVNGWGGGATNFLVIGNYLDMLTGEGKGGYGVYVDFDGFTEKGGYWTHLNFKGEARGIKCGWYASPRNPGIGQWANTVRVDLELDYCKQAVVNHSFNGLELKVRAQAHPVFFTEAEAEASPWIYSNRAVSLRDPAFWDLTDKQDFHTRCWSNRYTVDLRAGDNIIDDTFSSTFASAKYIAGTKPRHRLDGASGYIPRQANDQSAVISDLHDILYAHFKTAEKTTKAYKGRQDIEALDVVSDGAESPDVSIARGEMLWMWNKTFSQYSWNQQACDDDDYVEIVVACNPISVRDWWVTFSDGDAAPKKLQLILNGPSGETIDNQVREIEAIGGTSSGARTEWFRTPQMPFSTMIFRFIGCNKPGSIIPHYVAGVDSRHMHKNPLIVR